MKRQKSDGSQKQKSPSILGLADARGSRLFAPFPYFGGKRRAAELVWPRFGIVDNYVEPFCGSLAVLLSSPSDKQTETVNDLNGFIANFWRAIAADPKVVAEWSDYPVSEIDLEARHGWLVNHSRRLREWLQDPDFYDAKIAGRWVWGQCAWIGSGWCTNTGPWSSNGAEFAKHVHSAGGDQLPSFKRALPHLSNKGMGINRQIPEAADMDRSRFIFEWFQKLCARLRDVRVVCGDWKRIVTPTVTTRHGLTAVFLDPPYRSDAVAKGLYQQEAGVAAEVEAWCVENGNNPKLRIALCGYEGDYNLPGWIVVNGRATNGGYGSGAGNDNHRRERIWLSPHCLPLKN